MIPPVDDPVTLHRILSETEVLLLDFDGPICSVFAGIPAPVVANQLRGVLAEGGCTDLPEQVRTADDPFDVLFYAATLGREEAKVVEAAFRAHEVEAVQLAEPTPHTIDVMHAWKATGRRLAVVSNNSSAAVDTYLDIHGLRAEVDLVSARVGADVTLLKPSPHLVTDATNRLGSPASRCTLVGDSVTDIEASHAAQVTPIGYANKPGKADRLIAAGAVVVITSTSALISG
ncbi:HAD family hydrolase [Actinophytocola glycyrrhizae]|uniref:HAD family hydrolase n=1 Tax=Actinophytocola glycyrrhizae TaxID=2044873 RepID=A0ABV9RWC2_9PSEU